MDSSLGGITSIQTLTFNASVVGQELMFQAYCLNPPPDSCDYGPCPNADVTGIGQQISIYVASVTFVIAYVYAKSLIRQMLYTYLGVVYSLLIAASVSIGRKELTQNDGVFLLIAVVSPASLVIWILTIWSLWSPERFPVQIQRPKSKEVLSLKFLCMGTLIFEIIMIILMYAPLRRIEFSQPACNHSYGNKAWTKLIWMLPYPLQTLWAAGFFVISQILFRKMSSFIRHSPTQSQSEDIQYDAALDPVTWIELASGDDKMNGITWNLPLALAVVQTCAFPRMVFEINHNLQSLRGLVVFTINDNTCVVLISFAFILAKCFRERRRGVKTYKKKSGMLLILEIPLLLASMSTYSSIFPTSSDIVIVTMSLTILHRMRNERQAPAPRRWLMTGVRFYFGIVYVVIGRTFFTLPALVTDEGNWLGAKAQPLALNTYSLPVWVTTWLWTSVWPSGKYYFPAETWSRMTSRAHILKVGLLIITPHAIWIQSSVVSNPTSSYRMTFGQIFALILAVVSLAFLADTARTETSKETWKAFFLSKPLPLESPQSKDTVGTGGDNANTTDNNIDDANVGENGDGDNNTNRHQEPSGSMQAVSPA